MQCYGSSEVCSFCSQDVEAVMMMVYRSRDDHGLYVGVNFRFASMIFSLTNIEAKVGYVFEIPHKTGTMDILLEFMFWYA